MTRPKSPFPTELEFLILKVLWECAPLPVRDIRAALAAAGRDLAHTTVITTLGVMVRKKYVRRTRLGKAFLFSPRLTRDSVSQKMLGDIVQRVFDGSPTALMASLFKTTEVDRDEIQELRNLINEKYKEQSP